MSEVSPSKFREAQGRPGARRTRGPRAIKKHGEGTTGEGGIIRPSLRSGLRLIRALPGDRACLPPSCASLVTLRTWPQRREARTTRLRRPRSCRSSSAPTRPPHPARNVRDDASAPLQSRRDERDNASDLGKESSDFPKNGRCLLRQTGTTGNLCMPLMRDLPVGLYGYR